MPDRYVIEPAHVHWEARRPAILDSKRVADGFRYDSRNNGEWMTGEKLAEILQAEPA